MYLQLLSFVLISNFELSGIQRIMIRGRVTKELFLLIYCVCPAWASLSKDSEFIPEGVSPHSTSLSAGSYRQVGEAC